MCTSVSGRERTSSQLETGLVGCFPYVSPERPPARRLQLGEFCLWLYQHPPSSWQLQVAGFKNMGGIWECFFKYLASVLIHFLAQHCVSQELTQQTPHTVALLREKTLGCATRRCFTSIASPGQLSVEESVLRFDLPVPLLLPCSPSVGVQTLVLALRLSLSVRTSLLKHLTPRLQQGPGRRVCLLIMSFPWHLLPWGATKWVCVWQWVKWLHELFCNPLTLLLREFEKTLLIASGQGGKNWSLKIPLGQDYVVEVWISWGIGCSAFSDTKGPSPPPRQWIASSGSLTWSNQEVLGPSVRGQTLKLLGDLGEVIAIGFDTRKSSFFKKKVLGGWRVELPHPWFSLRALATTVDVWVLFLSVLFYYEKTMLRG